MITMGRHAAPSEDEPDLTVAEQPTVPLVDASIAARPAGSRPLPKPRGRHAHPDDDGLDDDDLEDVVPARMKRQSATAADLRLLRTDAALRKRVIAAVVVPFVLYVVVLLVIGRTDAFAVWVWLPLITAGIGGGLLLDAAHAKRKKAGG